MKKQSFITGAFLLAAATGLGKIFSAIFKIPLDRLFLHADGMAIFNGAYNIYMFFFSAATAGVPLAISQRIAFSDTKDEEESVVSTALIFTCLSLFAAAFAIFVFAEPIAAFIGMEDCTLPLRVMSPALVFCGITATLRGYFQGKMNMYPSALSQVSDSFGRLLIGFFMAYFLSALPLSMVCAGAIGGVPFGAFLSALILIAAAKKSHLHIRLHFSVKQLKKLLTAAIPITITASLHPIFNLSDTLSVVPTLKAAGFLNPQNAFGCLSRSATLYALPVSIATAVAASVLPAVAEYTKTSNVKALNRDASMATRLALVISVPCAAGFMAISKGILNFLFENSSNYLTLVFIAVSAVFLSVGEVMACILQGAGKIRCTVIAASVAIAAKLGFNILFMHVWGVNGAAAATSLSYLVFLLILLVFIKTSTAIRLSLTAHLVKPLFCGMLCFTAAYLASLKLSTFLSIIIAAIVYIPAVFLTRLVEIGEINQIFSGHKIEYNHR